MERGLFTFGCSLFALFSVSTVDRLSEKTTGSRPSVSGQPAMSLPTEINGFKKCQIKHDRNCIWLNARSHSEAGRGDLESAKYPRQDQESIKVSTTLLHPGQPRKGLNVQNTGIVL